MTKTVSGTFSFWTVFIFYCPSVSSGFLSLRAILCYGMFVAIEKDF